MSFRRDDSKLRKCTHHGSSHSKASLPLPTTTSRAPLQVKPHPPWEDCVWLIRMLRVRRPSTILWGLFLCGLFLLYISLPSPSHGSCDCNETGSSYPLTGNLLDDSNRVYPKDPHKLALLIPFRDRFEELLEFAPHIHNFLASQRKNHHIYVINQVDNLRFNRAALLNVGFLESGVDCDYVAMHDVDLLPLNPALVYEFPSDGPYHVAAPHLHPRYHYPTFIGGVLLINRQHFRKVDGLSNKYWGWGLEDDEFYARLKEAHLQVARPGNLTSGTQNTFKHVHDRRVRRRDMIKCHNQQEVTRHRDRDTGLSTLSYRIQARKELTIQGAPVTVLNVVLECDHSVTPWCDCTESIGNTPRDPQQSAKTQDVIVPRLNRKKHLTQDG
ncbi:hypothetical protein Pmani_001689 [Petrolisthes manimaculis]|uniref:Beta-1,4-N-acetylgalactosaminyltransferase n=1 Tax=Petrolisthes manimaculis TaxID=1843537 RepID=A0AAE1QLT5_9EUCA|nr:hypothetical protein Pmani_001689 [Petrolisthes manimaculis]